MDLPEVTIYTDGACSKGYGGWAARLIYYTDSLYLTGHEYNTTNNRMEMMAVIKSLEVLTTSCTVHLYSDSQYVLNGLTTWVNIWRKKKWCNADGAPIKNRDLWEQLYEVKNKHVIKPNWVKGHSGDAFNESVDSLAQLMRKQIEICEIKYKLRY